MKPQDSKKASGRLPDDVRTRVLELRRGHSLSQVAAMTGLPLGTVKTLCSRSGAFRDNLAHRALFTLPPIQESTNTDVSVPKLPPQQAVTGDKEIDAVLWLHTVIRTGQPALIEKAMLAAKKINTPLKTLEKRYTDYLVRAHPGNFMAALSSFGFADLDDMAERAVKKLARQREAHARFGNDVSQVYADTPAESFCIEVLHGLRVKKGEFSFDKKQVDSRFTGRPELLPHTLSDCLYELSYWHELYILRNSMDGYGDGSQEAQARDWFVFELMANIRPRSKAEAVAVFRYMSTSERMEMGESEAILLNLIGG